MALDLRNTDNNAFNQLMEHDGHNIRVSVYGYHGGGKKADNVAIECEDCGCVLVDFNNEDKKERKPNEPINNQKNCKELAKEVVDSWDEDTCREYATYYMEESFSGDYDAFLDAWYDKQSEDVCVDCGHASVAHNRMVDDKGNLLTKVKHCPCLECGCETQC